jgi:hypothetical protein
MREGTPVGQCPWWRPQCRREKDSASVIRPVNKGVKRITTSHHVYLPARFQEAICTTLHHLVELAILVNCLEKQSNSIHFTFRFFSIHTCSWVALTTTRCKQFQGWLRQSWPGSMHEVKDASTVELSVPCVNGSFWFWIRLASNRESW